MATRRIKAILEAQDRASPVFGRLTAAIGALGAVAVAVGTAAIARKLVGGIVKATEAAGSYEAQVARLNNALRNQGEATSARSRDLRKFAQDLTDSSLATETQILAAVAQAKALGASDEATKKLIRSATDLAAATGVSQDQAFRQVIRTLGGYAGELGEIFPELKDLTKEQLIAGDAADVLAAKVAGAGDAIAKTLPGAINNLNSAFKQLERAVGGPFRDAVRVTIDDALTPLVKKARDAVNESKSFRIAVLDAAISLNNFVLTVLGVLVALDSLKDKMTGNLGVFGALNRLFAFQMVALKIAAQEIRNYGDANAESGGILETLIETLTELNARFEKLKTAPSPFENLDDDADDAGDSITKLGTRMIEASEAVQMLVADGMEVIKAQIDSAKIEIEDMGKTMSRTFRDVGVRGAQRLGDAIVDAAFEGKLAFGDFLKQLAKDMAKAILQALILRAILGVVGFSRGGIVGGGPGGSTELSPGVFAAQKGFLVPGINQGKDSMLIKAQPGEMVLPAELTRFLLSAASGGGSAPVNVTIQVAPGSRLRAREAREFGATVAEVARRGLARA